ncbi:MAG: rod shape-determining protein MreC [Marinilabiliales bacterium]|nr:MAG: rod shape-determining protein MreC [Marinilabiliales bacterium]
MRNLLKLVIKYHFTLLFLLFEFIAFTMIVRYNTNQRASYLDSSNIVSGYLNGVVSSVGEYFSLKEVNEELSKENAQLKNQLKSAYNSNKISFLEIHDSIYTQKYEYTSAHIVKNTLNKNHNYITLDKGRRQGVVKEMAVVGPTGVVGIVNNVSYNYSSVISLLNTRLSISGKLKRTGYFGTVQWDGKNKNLIDLLEIPYHVDVQHGDSVVTSGYSTIFPEGILIGTVQETYLNQGDNFHTICVKLSTDFNNLNQVHLVKNLQKTEQQELEKQNDND